MCSAGHEDEQRSEEPAVKEEETSANKNNGTRKCQMDFMLNHILKCIPNYLRHKNTPHCSSSAEAVGWCYLPVGWRDISESMH